jgi:hypothetical protein
MIPEYLYRFEDYENTLGVHVRKREFKVIKETPCGYWIKLFYSFNDKKWVSKVAKKRYAYPSEQEAMINFKARKRRQIEILSAQLRTAKSALEWADPTGVYLERNFGLCMNHE